MAKQDKPRSLDRIQADLGENRSRMSETLDELSHRVSPGDAFSQVLERWDGSGGREFVTNLKRSAAHSPAPLGLVGLGLAWLMFSDQSSTQQQSLTQGNTSDASSNRRGAGELAAGAGSRTKGAARSAGQGVGRAANKGGAGVRRASDGARRGASRVGSAGRDGAAQARRGFDYMLHEEPLITGAIGVALGAMFAAGIPRTEREDTMMGGTRDGLVDNAQAFGKEQGQKARQVAESAFGAASDSAKREADNQGLGNTGQAGSHR